MQELTKEMQDLILKLYNFTLPEPRQSSFKNSPCNSSGNPDLTKREFEVMELIAKGLSNREICQTLFIDEKTLSTHRQGIYSKYQVHSAYKRHDSSCRVRAVLKHLKRTGRLKDF